MRAQFGIPAVLVLAAVVLVASPPAEACTNFIVTKGASADGSVFVTYAADSHEFYGALEFIPGGVHQEGETIEVLEWDTGKLLGRIAQAPRTYTVVGHINEFQVAMGESTWGGREELHDPEGIIDYGSLIKLGLQRGRTAREAIETMGALVAEYGYYSSGESISVTDPNEAWLLEIIGKGPANKGAVWVARRVPDGYVTGHANQPRIRQFPLDDPENSIYAEDVISFAREMGWYEGPDAEFNFADTYSPPSFGGVRFCDARVWRFFPRVAPSLDLSVELVKGIEGADNLPLWIKPDRKLTARDMMSLMRDHFEGTDLDLSVGVGAGPYACPYRWRPLTWEVDDEEYLNERAVSTQQTGFSFVAQSRSWLPDPIGGIIWFGMDDTASTVYVPLYAGLREPPYNFAMGTGDFETFTWDAGFWVFNVVANFTYSRYKDMIVDVQAVQQELEGSFEDRQPEVEKAALKLYENAPELARDYLTAYSHKQVEMTVARWRKLFEEMFVKYLDGNVRDAQGKVTHPAYSEEWYRRVVEEKGDLLKVRKFSTEPEEEEE
jgi:dipeptidase